MIINEKTRNIDKKFINESQCIISYHVILGSILTTQKKNVKYLYTLIEKTILGKAMRVKPHHREYFPSVKEVVEVEKWNKMIKILFSNKSTH